MKKLSICALFLMVFFLTACSSHKEAVKNEVVDTVSTSETSTQQLTEDNEVTSLEETIAEDVKEEIKNLKIQVGDYSFTAILEDNSSAQALKEYLADGPVTISLEDYAGMEKVGDLGVSLPKNDQQINTSAGDIILYQGRSFVIYYGTNSWSLTRLGKINDISSDDLKEILGNGDVEVTLSLE